MITIDLQTHFFSQARADHLQRMKSLLTSLDVDQFFSQQPDFEESLSQAVDLLEFRGVTDAYSQACVLLSLFAGHVDIQNIAIEQDPQVWVLRCIQQALHEGVSKSSFDCLFESLTGLGRFDRPWPSTQAQINLLDLLAVVHQNNQTKRIPCTHTGPIQGSFESIDDAQENLFRTESGFVHRVFGKFTIDNLITRICKNLLPEDPMIISVDPVFERCEIGREIASGFYPLQRIELIDTRPAKMDFKQRALSCSTDEKQRLQSSWLHSDALIEPLVQLSNPRLETSLNFHAQWIIHQGRPEFSIAADMQLQAAADALKWQARVTHQGVPVSLCIQAPRDIHIHWQHSEKKLPGQMPLGEPMWLSQHRVPLHVQMTSFIGVGKPLIRTVTPLAGELVFTLSLMLNAADHGLELILTVEQTELVCHWQSIDPVKGWTAGCWGLANASPIVKRVMQNG